jgi:site-specific DNA recombinase
VAEAPAPRLMPNLADLFREKVAALQEALMGEDAAVAREQIRSLIDEVRLIPSPTDPSAPLAIEVRGQLAAILALGSGSSEVAASALASQFKLVAGAGFEPAAFRL